MKHQKVNSQSNIEYGVRNPDEGSRIGSKFIVCGITAEDNMN